jgi:hypothetical protein
LVSDLRESEVSENTKGILFALPPAVKTVNHGTSWDLSPRKTYPGSVSVFAIPYSITPLNKFWNAKARN